MMQACGSCSARISNSSLRRERVLCVPSVGMMENCVLGQVPAHLMHAVALPQDPDVPVAIYEYRVRAVRIDETKSDMIWTREVWDVSDPSQPIWRIEDEQGTDITR